MQKKALEGAVSNDHIDDLNEVKQEEERQTPEDTDNHIKYLNDVNQEEPHINEGMEKDLLYF